MGAEGLAADVTMLVGNGYVPGHAELGAGVAARPSRGCVRLFDGAAARQTAAGNDEVPSTLYRGGRCTVRADPSATALLVRDGRIAWLGADADAPAADRVVDLGGALVTPAFVDAHVHATDTGLALSGLDLSGAARSAGELLAAVSAFALGSAGATRWCWGTAGTSRPGRMRSLPDAAALDRAGRWPAGVPVAGVDPFGVWSSARLAGGVSGAGGGAGISTRRAGCAATRIMWCGQRRFGR